MGINSKNYSALIRNLWSLMPFLFILGMFILHLAWPDKTFSLEERRYLTQWPVFHIETVFTGSYASKVESYFSDQFPFRDFLFENQFDIVKSK